VSFPQRDLPRVCLLLTPNIVCRAVTADEALDDKTFVSEMRSAILDAQYDSEEEDEQARPKYDMYDDELDDSYDGIMAPRSGGNFPRGGFVADDESETSSDDEETTDPNAIRESILVAAAVTEPEVFSIAWKKTEAAQALSRSTGWTFEQLAGWYRAWQSNVS